MTRVLADRREDRYQDSPRGSWQARWYLESDSVTGFVITRVAAAWSCTVEDLLRPCEDRDWRDVASYETASKGPEETDVLRLERPGVRKG